MKRAVWISVAATAFLASTWLRSAPGGASVAGSPFYVVPSPTGECENVPACSAVTGPWVVVPAHAEATYLISCPSSEGFLVGGTDARASSGDIEVWFDGILGAPIGVPTTDASRNSSLLFHAIAENGKPGSFQPIIGCITLKELDPRYPLGELPGVAASPAPTLRARLIQLVPGKQYGRLAPATSERCLAGQTIVGEWTALVFFMPEPPDVAGIAREASIHPSVSGDTVRALISTKPALFSSGSYPDVQVGLKCR